MGYRNTPAWDFQINVEQVLLLCSSKCTGEKKCHYSVNKIFMFVIFLFSFIFLSSVWLEMCLLAHYNSK